jgi:hypothetical protein
MSKIYECIKTLEEIRVYKKGKQYEIHSPKMIADDLWCEVEMELDDYTGGGNIRHSKMDEYFKLIPKE